MSEIKALIEFYECRGWDWLTIIEYKSRRLNNE